MLLINLDYMKIAEDEKMYN